MAEIDKVLGGYVRDLTPSHVPDFENVRTTARRRSRTRAAVVSVGAAAVVAIGVAGVVGAQPKGPDPTTVAITGSTRAATSPAQANQRTGAIPDSGVTKCADTYSPQAVGKRAFAFDGTVTRIGRGTTDRPDGKLGFSAVTFTVNAWFRGGTSPTMTADMAPPAGGGTPEAGPSYGIGSRLLVSGEPRWGGPALQDAIVFGCGFTRYYDAQTADAWRRASR
jgi:hypothetical protein